MLPQESLKKDARELIHLHWELEDRLRENEALRAYMIPLIAELGSLIRKHAQRLGEHTGYTCAFQVDHFGELMTWQLLEFLTQATFEGDMRQANTHLFQLTERHASDYFDYRAKSLITPEHPSQNRIQRRTQRLVKALSLHEEIEALADEMIPDVLPYTGGDEAKARKQARQWAFESVSELLAAHISEDVIFIGE